MSAAEANGSISGDPYMGFIGKPSDPASGQLRIDWSL